MADRSSPALTRRLLLAAGLALPARQALGASPKVITLLGDSITAGYGLPAKDALPAQLRAALARLGTQAIVRGAGVSGDTTAGGAARVDFSVRPDTSLCVVALGGNDLLRGLEIRQTHANLERILRRLKQRRIPALLAGIAAPREFGANFATNFNAVFPSLAKAYGVALYPDLLKGVARNLALNQRDGIHPNAAGVRVIAANLAPVIAAALKGRA